VLAPRKNETLDVMSKT